MVEGPDTGGGTGTTGQPGGERPENGFPGDMFGDLDEETLEKVQNIMEQGDRERLLERKLRCSWSSMSGGDRP
ncbi:hypothetical protein V6B33_17195 [Mangrovibacillus sp. Mu-81]|uniref:hypothetical protein n=1 Tax=Mangrovibacillus sp. Mu-81 TaxID=3121478 RepID=UPI002FE4DEA2